MKNFFLQFGAIAAVALCVGCGSNNPASLDQGNFSVSPANGATGVATAMSLSWTASPLAVSYSVQVSTNATFATVFVEQTGLTTPKCNLSGLSGTTAYYWREGAETGKWAGVWSETYAFTTEATIPPVPTLALPANDKAGQATSLTLSWNPSNGAASYGLQIATDASFTTTVLSDGGIAASSFAAGGLQMYATYYWRVNAVDVVGMSDWSGAWSFTVGNIKVILPTMVNIPAGTFQMGGTGLYASPVHSVTLGAFTMSQTLVTQEQYLAVMATNPSYFDSGSTWPVEQVNWYDAVLFCNRLSVFAGLDTVYTYSGIYQGSGYDTLTNVAINYSGNGYRLPTEAEYEYACRAGTTTDFYWGRNYPPLTSADTLAMDSNAVWNYNSPNGTHLVASKKPNAWGMYDMAGNLWEWCNDWFGSYQSGAQTNPSGPGSGSYRVLRGGSWDDNAVALAASYRNIYYPGSGRYYYGFRVVCGPR